MATPKQPSSSSVEAESRKPLLTDGDLGNADRFLKIARVPLIDAHNDPIKGDISSDLLKLIAKNSNDRVKKGDPIVVTVGHMKRKNTIVVVRPDGSKIILPGTDESNQPPIVGYAKNLTVDRFRDNDWIHGDLYIKADQADAPIENPFRSVERVVPPDDGEDDGEDSTRHYIDRISLLRTPPEREGGVLHYDREADIIGCCGTTRKLLKICYSRDQSPLGDVNMPETVDDPIPEEAPPALSDEDGDESDGLPSTVGEMSPQDFFEGFAHVLRLVLDEKAGGGETLPERNDETVPYEATEAGGTNTFIPTNGKKPGRQNYERREKPVVKPKNVTTPRLPAPPPSPAQLKEVITRHQYSKDKGETDEILTYLYGQLNDMQLNGRRTIYGQTLRSMRDAEGVELEDEDIDTLINQVTDMTPENHEEEKIKEIRKHYARRAVNVPGIPVGLPPFSTDRTIQEAPATPQEVRRATAIRMDSGGKLTYAESLAKARGK